MSIYSQPDREKQDRYRGDVIYDVWRSGGNVDRIDYDRVTDGYYDGRDAESMAASELRRMRPWAEEEFGEQWPPEEQFPNEPMPEDSRCST